VLAGGTARSFTVRQCPDRREAPGARRPATLRAVPGAINARQSRDVI